MDRRAVVLAAALAALAPGGVRSSAGAAAFADVPANHRAYAAIQTLSADGLIDGFPDGSFKGDRPLTRDEMAAIVVRVSAKLEALGAGNASKTGLDALQKVIAALRNELDGLGVRVTSLEDTVAALDRRPRGTPSVVDTADEPVDGYPGGPSAGNRPLTRYEMAAIVARVVAKIEAVGAGSASQTDLDALQQLIAALKDELAGLGVRVTSLEDAVAALDRRPRFAPSVVAAADGPVGGYADGPATGDRPLTRDEMAAIVARVSAKIEAVEAVSASKTDLDALQKFVAALRDELDGLGVRVTSLEDAVAGLDRRPRVALAANREDVNFRLRF